MQLVEIDEDLKAFLVESYENLNEVERDIIEIEKTPDNQEVYDRIYRSIHTIKGNCGFLPFSKLESVAHVSENLLGCLRDRKLALNPAITSVLLQVVDAIRQLLNHIETTGHENEADYSELIKTLNQFQANGNQLSAPLVVDTQKADAPLSIVFEAVSETAQPRNADTAEASTLSTSESSIRVNVSLLDQVMNLVGELVLARNQIIQFAATQEDAAFSATCQGLNLITTELQEGIMKTRMQPISTLWQKFPRVTRDLAIACGKQVRVEMEGMETELDKTIIEAIKDPLTHIVRNCVDHGIESPAARTACGKPIEGCLLLRAFHESGQVNIEISDDGAGIEPERLKQKAQQLGLITSAQAALMSESEAMNLIFLPGFSTAQRVTNISGRGVGMDVVKTNIEKINGTVDIQSHLGQGTTFKIKIPLTLAIIPALIVTSGGDRYAIPQGSLLELVRLEGDGARRGIEMLYDVPVYRLRGNLLPLVYLNRELQLEDTAVAAGTTTTDEDTINIVVLQADDYSFGLVVDTINDTQEIVVKPLGKLLKEISTFAGATILGDGRVALIIDVIGFGQRAGVISEMRNRLATKAVQVQQQEDNRQMLLLFQGPDGGRMAIPLTLASRLEEFPRSAVERTGNQHVVQYRGKILSLTDLYTVFPATGQHLTPLEPKFSATQDDTIQVVVVSFDQEHSIGLVVERILDIVEEPLTIQGTASRPGVLSLAVIQGQVTELLDVENIIRIANPHFFTRLVATSAPSLAYA